MLRRFRAIGVCAMATARNAGTVADEPEAIEEPPGLVHPGRARPACGARRRDVSTIPARSASMVDLAGRGAGGSAAPVTPARRRSDRGPLVEQLTGCSQAARLVGHPCCEGCGGLGSSGDPPARVLRRRHAHRPDVVEQPHAATVLSASSLDRWGRPVVRWRLRRHRAREPCSPALGSSVAGPLRATTVSQTARPLNAKSRSRGPRVAAPCWYRSGAALSTAL